MRTLAFCALLSGLFAVGCGDDGDAGTKPPNSRAGTGNGLDGSVTITPTVRDSGPPETASSVAPQGSCPEGFRCTMVPGGDNQQRACIAPGELFAPSCNVAADCVKLPGASCIDPGFNFGSLCALRCTP
jgi:hypothetical protein